MVNASGDRAKSRQTGLAETIQKLPRLSVRELKVRYREVFGEEARILHKEYLLRRIAWQLQASVEGDLSERARRRMAEIADVSDLGGGRPAVWRMTQTPSVGPLSPQQPSVVVRDPRLPPAGTLLRRPYRGREVVVKVLEDGFAYDSKRYRSLSAIARQVTGTRWNGLLFFGLAERGHA